MSDFSTNLLKKKAARNYPPVLPDSTVYEILPRGYSTTRPTLDPAVEQETTEARLRRLRFELDELELDLEAVPTNLEPTGLPQGIPAATALLAQLRTMRRDMSKLTTQSQIHVQAAPSSAENQKQPVAQREAPSTSIVELSSQLASLEHLIGPSALTELDTSTTSSSQIASSATPLVMTLAKLENQLSLLTQPRHLDTLGRRIKTMVSELEKIHETRRKLGDTTPLNLALSSGLTVSTPGDPTAQNSQTVAETAGVDLPADVIPRLQALFQVLPRLQPLIPLAPNLLLRLKTLSQLHSSAETFSSDLDEATQAVGSMKESTDSIQKVLLNVQESLRANQEVMHGNVKALEDRVTALTERIARLQSE